jgi:hypothetical protein
MKEMMKKLEELENIATIADKEYENEPENEEKENAFDIAYKNEYIFFNEVAEEIVKITSGKIELKIAREMLRTKRNELKVLFN